MRRTSIFILFLLLALIFPSAATAADTVPNTLLISLWPEYNNNQVFFMQQVSLPTDSPLPVTVRFAFPSGVQVQWTGEIVGTTVSQDIQATPTVTKKDGYDEVAITLTKSRIGQAEAVWDGLKIDGQKRSMVLDWIQRYDTRTTTFEFQQPSKSSDVVMTPQPISNKQNPEGFTVYDTAPKRIVVGQGETFSVTYNRAVNTPSVNDATSGGTAAAGATANATQPFNYWIIAVILIVGAAAGGWYVYIESKKL